MDINHGPGTVTHDEKVHLLRTAPYTASSEVQETKAQTE